MAKRRDALEYHRQQPPGKIEVNPTKPCLTQADLSLAYTPGVAEPCREIADNPEKAFEYTAKGNLVAVVTNGTAVLGLGNIGPAAGKPVMEGKAVLFKRFAGIDVFDIELDAPSVTTFCQAVMAMAPTFGGINIEDVKAPDCFLIEERLRNELDIPVFHDDQHGTAIIICAGLVNALDLQGKTFANARFVFSGAGAAAIATARLIQCLGAKRENILLVDSRGVVRAGDPRVQDNPYKAQYAADTERQTLADAFVDADVFIGVSVGGLVTAEMIKTMADRPTIFALANPDPEIPYDLARAARPDAICATGRTDFPNQVNNVLGFPFIFRGALDARARTVNEPMMIAAVRALADLAREDVEDTVSEAYGGVQLHYGPEYIIPKPFDARVLLRVAPAVALAATMSGVARKQINDIDAYRERLEKLLGKPREVMRFAVGRAKNSPKRVAFAQGEHEKVLRATAQVLEEEIARPILIGRRPQIAARIDELNLDLDVDRLDVVTPTDAPFRAEFADKLFALRQRKGMSRQQVERRLDNPTWLAAMMAREGLADGVVCGPLDSFHEPLSPLLQVIGTSPEAQRVAGVHLMVIGDEIFFFADTTLNEDPSAVELAEIACLTADLAVSFDVLPRVAMLSFSNFGTVRSARSAKVRQATELVRTWRPELEVEGEIHADVALMPEVARALYPFSKLTNRANILVFPSLEAANIAQKIAQCTGAEAAIGPILVGMNRAVNIASPYSKVGDIVMAAAVTAMMAEQRPAPEPAADLLRFASAGRSEDRDGHENEGARG